MLRDYLSVNTYDKHSLEIAKENGFGLEVEEYLWTYTQDEILEKRKVVPGLMSGFSRFSFHGTAISRDIIGINKMSDDQLMNVYQESYQHAYFHGIDKIVFHSNYLADMATADSWISHNADLWQRFLEDKPASLCVYIENFIDDTPDLLAQLCDRINDPRLKICLDVGHAGCNSSISLQEWIIQLGKHIGHVHLHNNDGLTDKHWPLGQGILDMSGAIQYLIKYADAATYVLECNLEQSLHWLGENEFLGELK